MADSTIKCGSTCWQLYQLTPTIPDVTLQTFNARNWPMPYGNWRQVEHNSSVSYTTHYPDGQMNVYNGVKAADGTIIINAEQGQQFSYYNNGWRQTQGFYRHNVYIEQLIEYQANGLPTHVDDKRTKSTFGYSSYQQTLAYTTTVTKVQYGVLKPPVPGKGKQHYYNLIGTSTVEYLLAQR